MLLIATCCEISWLCVIQVVLYRYSGNRPNCKLENRLSSKGTFIHDWHSRIPGTRQGQLGPCAGSARWRPYASLAISCHEGTAQWWCEWVMDSNPNSVYIYIYASSFLDIIASRGTDLKSLDVPGVSIWKSWLCQCNDILIGHFGDDYLWW
jgi:hypothetical protein